MPDPPIKDEEWSYDESPMSWSDTLLVVGLLFAGVVAIIVVLAVLFA